MISRVLEREGAQLADSPLAGAPVATIETDTGFVFHYPAVTYGLVRRGGDGSSDVVYEDLGIDGAIAGRLFDVAGREVDLERVAGLVARLAR